MKTITISVQAAIITLLSVGILVCGAYFYRGYDLLTMKTQLSNTQVIISQLNFDPQVAAAFRQCGYMVNVATAVTAPASILENDAKDNAKE